MFKISSFEQELMKEMQSRLVQNQAENQYSFNKLAKAADYLNNAAELFDDVGMNKEAEVVTRLIEKLAAEGEEDLAPMTESEGPFTAELDYGPADKTVEVDTILKKIERLNLNLNEFRVLERGLHKIIELAGYKPLSETVFGSVNKDVLDAPVEVSEFEEEQLAPITASLRTKKKV